ncbi:MAG: DinB family protein [Saprospiraceae bacterium]
MKKTAIIRGLEEKFAMLTGFLDNLPEGRLSPPLAPGKWSIGQHVTHLILSTAPVVKALGLPKPVLREKFGTRGDAIERGEAELIAFYKKALAGGLTAPPRLTPEAVAEDQKALLIETLRQECAQLVAALEPWEESDLSEYMLPHPALGALTMREMLIFTIFHTGHHMAAMGQG